MRKILLLSAVFALLVASNVTAQFVVIANKSVSESLSDKKALKDVFTLDILKWKNGEQIKIFDCASCNEEGKEKLSANIGTTLSNLKKVWLKKKLTGEGEPPTVLSGVDAIIEKVKSTPGAIGIIPKDKVTSDVKIIANL